MSFMLTVLLMTLSIGNEVSRAVVGFIDPEFSSHCVS